MMMNQCEFHGNKALTSISGFFFLFFVHIHFERNINERRRPKTYIAKIQFTQFIQSTLYERKCEKHVLGNRIKSNASVFLFRIRCQCMYACEVYSLSYANRRRKKRRRRRERRQIKHTTAFILWYCCQFESALDFKLHIAHGNC